MRIAELSRTSGVPVPSIKYYLRVGLLPQGERTAPNQADYDDDHLHRLRLIRALIEVGGLSIAAVKELLASLDAHGNDLYDALGEVMKATMPARTSTDSQYLEQAKETVQRLLVARGWDNHPNGAPVESLVAAVEVFYRLRQPDVEQILEMYADHIEQLAPRELEWATKRGNVDAVVEAAIVGTFIGGAAFSAMRSLAHEAEASERLSPK